MICEDFSPRRKNPPGYEALRVFGAARRAHSPPQMRPNEVGDAMCPQLAASDRLALRSRERRFESGRGFVKATPAGRSSVRISTR